MPQLPFDCPIRCHKMPHKCHNATDLYTAENQRCHKCHKCHNEKGVRMYARKCCPKNTKSPEEEHLLPQG